jgi:hypothetical protein
VTEADAARRDHGTAHHPHRCTHPDCGARTESDYFGSAHAHYRHHRQLVHGILAPPGCSPTCSGFGPLGEQEADYSLQSQLLVKANGGRRRVGLWRPGPTWDGARWTAGVTVDGTDQEWVCVNGYWRAR